MSFALVLNRLRQIGSIASIALFAAVLLAIAGGSAMAWDVTIAWDPNGEPNLEGYTVYYAKHSPGPPYDFVGDLPISTIPDPDHPSTSVTNLEKNVNYYFALTAYDTDGNESSFSQQLCVIVGETIRECAPAAAASSFSSSSGSSSSGSFAACFIRAAGDSTTSAAPTTIPLILCGLPIVLAIILTAACSKRKQHPGKSS